MWIREAVKKVLADFFRYQVQTQILIKLHLQNLDQVFTSKSQPNITISTKLKIQNID